MKLQNIGNDERKRLVNIFEVVAPKPNPPGTHDIHEQDNTATLRNAAKANQIINKLRKK